MQETTVRSFTGCVTQEFMHIIIFTNTAKPILLRESHTIIKDERENILLTCDLEYAYPLPNITWSVKSALTDNYIVMKNSSVERDYSLQNNFTIEIYHRFLSEAGYLNVMCSVDNLYGSAQMVYHLWEDAAFKASMILLFASNVLCYLFVYSNCIAFILLHMHKSIVSTLMVITFPEFPLLLAFTSTV